MDCPCGTGRAYADCCGPLIDDNAPGADPAAVMRARYTSHVVDKVEYLLESNHPDTRETVELEASRAWARNAEWEGLEVVSAPEPRGDEAEVEFVARYAYNGDHLAHHELARFKRHGEQGWLYLDGEMVKPRPFVREEPRVGRNDPCPCGSGKKYKKCHGA